MNNLAPLTTLLGPGAEGGHEFERLINQLLLSYADKQGFLYEPSGGAGADAGLDGLAPNGRVPGMDGPVGFQCKWLWDHLDKGSKARQIEDSLQRASKHFERIRHWVLVTPHDLTLNEQEWFNQLSQSLGLAFHDSREMSDDYQLRIDLRLHHWGKQKIESLLPLCPPLFARYYPQAAREQLSVHMPGYTGFVFSAFGSDYRKQLVLEFEHLRTLGLPSEALRREDYQKRVPLNEVFVPLSLVPERRPSMTIHLAALLQSQSPSVVLGDPGTGKTTLLNFLALLFAGGASLQGFQPSPRRLPLLIRLRDFVALQHKQPEMDFIGFLESRARSDFALPHAHRAFFEATLRMGEAIVLFDGLDEVGGAASRARVCRAVRAFQSQYSGCPCCVTSRVYGYTGDVRLPDHDFTHYRIARLDPAQIEDFIQRWYTIQFPSNEREREKRRDSLATAVQRTPSIRRLAGNPLLLTLMAFIHYGRSSLPKDRAELYEQCIQMLLKTWQEARIEDGRSREAHAFERLGVRIHETTQKDYLAHLAMFIQVRDQSKSLSDDENASSKDVRGLMGRGEALNCLAARHLEKARRNRPELELGQAREEMELFVDYIADRTGLLLDKGGEQLAFIHLSFQEYLAAWLFICSPVEAIIQEKFFREHLGRQAWEEVLLLRLYLISTLPGAGGETVFDAVVSALLIELKDKPLHAGWLTLAHALRDDLNFSIISAQTLIRHTISALAQQVGWPTDWLMALQDIAVFSDRWRGLLQEELAREWQRPEPRLQIACLHLHSTLQPLLSERADRRQWSNVFASLESPTAYRLTLDFATKPSIVTERGFALAGALTTLSYRILKELICRNQFLVSRRGGGCGGEFIRYSGVVEAQFAQHGMRWPLAALRAHPLELHRTFQGRPLSLLSYDREALWLRELASEACEEKLSSWLRSTVNTLLRQCADVAETGSSVVDGLVRAFDSTFSVNATRTFVRDTLRQRMGDAVVVAESASRSSEKDMKCSFAQNARALFAGRLDEECAPAFVQQRVASFGREFIERVIADFGETLAGICPSAVCRDLTRPFKELLNPHFDHCERRNRLPEANAEALWLVSHPYYWDWPWLYKPVCKVELTGEAQALDIRLMNPLDLPYLLVDIWRPVVYNAVYCLRRDFADFSGKRSELWPAVDSWLLTQPLEPICVGIAWEGWAQQFKDSRACLKGDAGALMLMHAAYSALRSGLHLDGPIWTGLIETRDVDDPMIHFCWLLHELCHFRRDEQMGQEANAFLASCPSEIRPILEDAGWISEGQPTFRFLVDCASVRGSDAVLH